MSKIETKRIAWIDWCKGFGILLVVLGHTYGIPEVLHLLIYAFHMPLFFILSGWTISNNEYPIVTVVRKAAKQCLLPYFLYAIVNLVLHCSWLTLSRSLSIKLLGKYIVGLLLCYSNTEWMPNCTPIWFLVCLFVARVLFSLISRIKSKWIQFILIISCMTTSWVIGWSEVLFIPWKIETALTAVGFVWIGNQICKMDSYKQQWVLTLMAMVSLVMCASIVENAANVDMNSNHYGNYLLFLLGGIGFSFILICVAKLLAGKLRFACLLGRSTLTIVGFNYMARSLSTELYYMIPGVRNAPITWGSSFLATICILVFLILLEGYLKTKVDLVRYRHKDEVQQ